MQSIRIGNDISIEWVIKRTGNPESFEGKDVSVMLLDYMEREQNIRFSIERNIISIDFQGKDQKCLGEYSLVIVENSGKPEMATLDQIDVFSLVPSSSMEGGQDACPDLRVNKIKLESNFIVEHRVRVVDNLNSSSATDALSAGQGKELANRIMQQGKRIPFKMSQIENDLNYVAKEFVDEVNRLQNIKIRENGIKSREADDKASEILKILPNFVKTKEGYGLSQNDFNDYYKARVDNLENYDDGDIYKKYESLKKSVDELYSRLPKNI